MNTILTLSSYEMGLDVAQKASELRAVERIKSPDAIQLATAMLYGATLFLTNDKIFERAKGIDIFILDKLLKGEDRSDAKPLR